MAFVGRLGEHAILAFVLSSTGLFAASPPAYAAGPEDMTFFLTGIGSGKGADLWP